MWLFLWYSDQKSDLKKDQLLRLRNPKLLKIVYFTEIMFFLYKIINFFHIFLDSSCNLAIFLTMQNLKESSLKLIAFIILIRIRFLHKKCVF